MGKSGGKKKKGVANQNQVFGANIPIRNANGGVDLSIFLKRAHELKEDGNNRFQAKDYVGALEQYNNALKLTPKNHPDRAVFHSNKAACLMQMRPIDYGTVIVECNMALHFQPLYVRALLRRARAFEAIGKYEMAMQDVQTLLCAEPNHLDALEISRRLRTALGLCQEARQELQNRPSLAAPGASAVRGAPVVGLGPTLVAQPVTKKAAAVPVGPIASSSGKAKIPQPVVSTENGLDVREHSPPTCALRPSNGSSKFNANPNMGDQKEKQSSFSLSNPLNGQASTTVVQWRPLKLVYDHDIRLAQMPVNCSFRTLREIIGKRFPSSMSVLMKYKDNDGDLVTITCTAELRLAESCTDRLMPKEPEADKSNLVGMLRLYIVEVNSEQEPSLLEEEDDRPCESERIKVDESGSHHSTSDIVSETVDVEIDKTEKDDAKEKPGSSEDSDGRELEMDDWLFEFAQLFRTYVGVDPDAHIDLHELGMELCSEALEETVTSEAAQNLFDKAASKFQEVATLAFFNWGNVHMCAARKRIPIKDSAAKELVVAQLHSAYDWVKGQYSLAREKYEKALLIKPDFHEGLLALGQQQFEMAKLHWSFVLAKKEDLSKWDPTETLELFNNAEEKMKAATEMWEKLEVQRDKELKDSSLTWKEELSKRRRKATEGESRAIGVEGEISADEAAEQAAVMKSQTYLFWGNMLFERSQVECKLNLSVWNKRLDAAIERFRLAGASNADISMVLKNHCSNGDSIKGDVKNNEKLSSVANEGDAKNEINEV